MTDTILPHEMPKALDRHAGIKILSLDCFDTLLWRDTHAPRDLFGMLPETSVLQRQWAEMRARTGARVRRRRPEVSIAEIYRELLPNATDAERAAAIQAEIDAEAVHCFGFVPTVELMREAKRRGLQVIIVSDTYLNAEQLRGLIAASAGADVAALIDQLFCSSVYGLSKGEGLYEKVLGEVDAAASEILHIGDNKGADVHGVQPFGVRTVHLKQFGEGTEQRLRLEAAVSAILHPVADGVTINHQPHRAALAAGEPQIEDHEEAFGFTTLGPVLHGFDRWLADEAAELKARHGGTVHHIFLMRDGYLPMRIHQARPDAVPAHAVEISRFTAIAGTLRDGATIDRYVVAEIHSDLKAVAKQLLLPGGDIAAVMKKLPRREPGLAFAREMRDPARVRRIVKASAAFGERLVQHVRATVNPQPGDTLMLIDLGYNGTVQNEVDWLLREKLNVHVAGRYLLLREQYRSGLDKRGFVDARHYDANTLEAMCGNVAVFEQVCTAAQGSVVDYAADGTPIRKENSIKGRQSDVRERIQAGAIRFAQIQRSVIVRGGRPDDAEMWRRGAASAMARLMFLPMAHELAAVAEFEHDVNLGVDNTVPLFDRAIAQKGLRQRGLFYMKGSERMYLPAELHGEGLALKLSLLAHKRFGLALKYADFVDNTIRLPVIVADGVEVTQGHVTATPTHDGYYMAPIPIGDCRFSVGLQFGQLFDWVQVESASFMPVETFLNEDARLGADERPAAPSLEGMTQVAPGLFRSADEFGFMMVPPPARSDDRPMMLAIVFRPIAARTPREAPKSQSALDALVGTAGAH